jgi:hypothetical protein
MRVLFFLLVAANLALAGYALLRPTGGQEAHLLSEQLNADQIRIIPPPPPAPPAARKVGCIEWGSFSQAELAIARHALEPLQLGERVTVIDVPAVANWWVFIPPLKDRAELDKKTAELEELGVTEYHPVESPGPLRYAISLGIFRNEDTASRFLEGLQQKGVRSARVTNREHRLTLAALVLRDTDGQLHARLAELQAQVPGSELRALDCPP